ncbi:hypothetical protein ERJ75_000939900 [Trypanosoma vivax]|nr:hypothetical protein ERJ75_000939900 [Trypanosoma vivax]
MAKLPFVPPKVAGKVKAPRPLFNGRGVLRRARITRVPAEEEQRQSPLQRVGVGTLSLEWVRRGLDAVWRNVPQTPGPHSSSHEPQLGIDGADAGVMGSSGVVFEAPRKTTKGFVAPFVAVEGRPGGLRRRFVAWPKGKNDHDDCEAGAAAAA